ncbi:MAG: GNAT family N-acetyltransferase [Candidatus Thorarchaeota archaeon]
MEQEDYEDYTRYVNNIEIQGEFLFGRQKSILEIEKQYSTRSSEWGTFIIEKKDGTMIGIIHFFDSKFGGYAKSKEVGYFLLPEERRKGFCSEAVGLVLDYLFLVYPLVRIQAVFSTTNDASRRVPEENGFQQEGTLRKLAYFSGKHIDIEIFSVMREEWNDPNVLDLGFK